MKFRGPPSSTYHLNDVPPVAIFLSRRGDNRAIRIIKLRRKYKRDVKLPVSIWKTECSFVRVLDDPGTCLAQICVFGRLDPSVSIFFSPSSQGTVGSMSAHNVDCMVVIPLHATGLRVRVIIVLVLTREGNVFPPPVPRGLGA